MFDGVPFGSAGRVVGHSDGQGRRVGQLRLEFRFPGVTATTIATAGVVQYENLARTGVTLRAFPMPPVGDGMSGESGSIVGNADYEGAAILGDVIDSVGNRDADGVAAEVVIKDAAGIAFPASAGVLEVADQFAFLGVDANDGQVTALEAAAQLGQVFELEVAVGAGVGGDLLVIDV